MANLGTIRMGRFDRHRAREVRCNSLDLKKGAALLGRYPVIDMSSDPALNFVQTFRVLGRLRGGLFCDHPYVGVPVTRGFNLLRSLCGRGEDRCAAGQCSVHTSLPEQLRRSDKRQRVSVLG